MKIVWSWLKEYLPDLKVTPQEVAARLNLSSFEVESVEKAGEDFVIDLNILPNRPDALGVLGVAREVSALFQVNLQAPQLTRLKFVACSKLNVKIQAKDLCRRYVGVLIEGVQIKSSPQWMQKRLEAAGIRPINNVVDITNYVMLEYGQPLHAFDAELVAGKKINVRLAKEGEKIITLDGVERKLNGEMLVIADAKKPIALAGIMGGAESEISEKTQNIILESANFNPVSIHKTSKALNLRSESSMRFERGLDQETTLLAAQRAVQLLELAGGEVLSFSDLLISPIPPAPRIRISPAKIKAFLGVDISPQQILNILISLDFSVEKGKMDLVAIPPHFRQDIKEEADIMEEIARIYRYENIPATLPAGRFAPPVLPKIEQLTKKVKDVLFAEGFQELNTFSFMSAKTAEKFSRAKSSLVEIVNPLSQEYQYLRTSLLPALLSAIQENQDENILRLFEINPVYVKEGDKYSEPQLLTGVIIGPSPSYPDRPDYPTAAEFFQAKGVVEQILTELKINFSFKEKKESNFHPGRTAAIIAKRDEIGVVGELHPNFLAELNIKKRVAVFIVGIEALKDIAGEIIYKTVSKYPEARFDLSLLADKETLAETIEKTAKAASEFVKKFDLFDYYEGKGISEDKKSLTYHVVLQAKDHTLSDEEIKGVREKIIKELKNINVLLRV